MSYANRINKKYKILKNCNSIQHKKKPIDQYKELEKLQTYLDDLQADRASMEIVYQSLRNAYAINPHVQSEEVDLEIRTAYDDLMAQVRQLDRSLQRLDKIIKATEQKKLY